MSTHLSTSPRGELEVLWEMYGEVVTAPAHHSLRAGQLRASVLNRETCEVLQQVTSH